MRFLDLFIGAFSLYSSINPCCLSSKSPSLSALFFKIIIIILIRSAAFSYLQRKLGAFSRVPQLPAGLFCHKLLCLRLQPNAGERGRELGAGTGAPGGPATALLPEHHFPWQEPAGTAALCRRAEGSPYAFTEVLINTGVRR